MLYFCDSYINKDKIPVRQQKTYCPPCPTGIVFKMM
nr:MAG TPA: Protein of unknown function (DUF1223) [Caudoviricetes sp.]